MRSFVTTFLWIVFFGLVFVAWVLMKPAPVKAAELITKDVKHDVSGYMDNTTRPDHIQAVTIDGKLWFTNIPQPGSKPATEKEIREYIKVKPKKFFIIREGQ